MPFVPTVLRPFPPDITAPTAPVLAAPSIVGTTASLSWAASTDLESGVVGYKVYRDGSALPSVVRALSFDDTALTNGSHTWTVSGLDASGNESVQSNSRTASVGSAQLIKWNPGFYVNPSVSPVGALPTTAQLNEFQAMPNVKGVLVILLWGQLNTGNGVYDWTLTDQAISQASSRGLRVIFRLMDRTFGAQNQNLVVPADMSDNAAYGGGYYQKASGRIARIWRQDVMDRYMAFLAKFAEKYDNHPYVEAIRTEETDSKLSSPFPSDYSHTAYKNTLIRFATEAPALFPHTSVYIQTNFTSTQSYMEEIFEACYAGRCGAGGPDLVPTTPGIDGTPGHTPTWGDRVYGGAHWDGSWTTGGVNYKGLMDYCCEIQSPEMGGKEGCWSAQQFYDYAKNTFGMQRMIWLRKNFNSSDPTQDLYWDNTASPAGGAVPDVKTFINAGGHPMVTTPPSYYNGNVITGGT